MEHDQEWIRRLTNAIGQSVAHYRQNATDERGRKLTAQALSDRCAVLGLEIGRPAIAKLESGHRQAITVAEVNVLAKALGVAPVDLMFPIGRALTVEVLPGQHMDPWEAYQWFVDGASGPAALWAEHDRLSSLLTDLTGQRREFLERLGVPDDEGRTTLDMQVDALGSALRRLRATMRERGLTPPPLPAALAQPVVAAIVTSRLGVLAGRRNDGRPPWTFVAGEQEPGERPEDTAIREVKEETGLRIQTGDIIGDRVHPKTGRRMIYIAAAPTHGTDVFVGDEDELAEVRWLTLAEADELLTGMFGPVRAHLARKLGEAEG